jgi:hypothetical protein
VDAVLQVGHDYEKQVRKRVERVRGHPEAATLSGFIGLLHEQGISRLLDWNSQGTEKDLLDVAEFFSKRGMETFSQMREWLKSEENRDSLLTDRSKLGGNTNTTFKVADKTADYLRLLVGHFDAVAVDSNIKALLESAGISTKYDYKQKRVIIQLAALEMGIRPIDLDLSIYNDSLVHRERYKPRRRLSTGSVDQKGRSGSGRVGPMPKKGDVFRGKINDLCLRDAKGWRRRDIWFFKCEVSRREKCGYPTRFDRILLIDTAGKRYELNFSKPDSVNKICLGTPSKLKPWYQKKGFDYHSVNPDDCVYFEYTGSGNEFCIYTEHEYSLKHNK